MKTETFDFFPYGCQYHRAPTPPREEWEDDLAEIARAGYTHVQFRPQWRCHERRRGEFVWDDLDRLFDLAARNRLRVILKAQLENAPDWVFTELGGTRIGSHNQPLDPIAHAAFYVGGWWPCFDNPRVAEAATELPGNWRNAIKDTRRSGSTTHGTNRAAVRSASAGVNTPSPPTATGCADATAPLRR